MKEPYYGSFFIGRRLPGMNKILEMRANVNGCGPKGKRANEYSREKKLLEIEIGWALAIAQRDGGLMPVRTGFFTFVFFEPDARRDPDNITAGCKFIFDAMVRSKMLLSDRQKDVLGIANYWTVSKVRTGVFVAIDDERVFSKEEAIELAGKEQ